MANSTPVPTAPPVRSKGQQLHDLARDRDRTASDLMKAKRLLGAVRDAVFNPGWAPEQMVAAIRQHLVDDWDTATPPGRVFDLVRFHDGTGVSGSGRVAEGFQFENGKVVLCWLGKFSSVNVYESIEHVQVIHGHGGSTKVKFR